MIFIKNRNTFYICKYSKTLIIGRGFLQQEAINFLQNSGHDIHFFSDNIYQTKFYHCYVNVLNGLFLKINVAEDLGSKHKKEYLLIQTI